MERAALIGQLLRRSDTEQWRLTGGLSISRRRRKPSARSSKFALIPLETTHQGNDPVNTQHDPPPGNRSLSYGSVCSSIEAVSLAWQPLGLAPAWF